MAETAESRVVTLPAVVDLDALDMVRDGLLEALESGSVSVDAAGVERLATNALLMLVSAGETARRTGLGFAIVAASAPLQAAIDRLGLRAIFADMMKG